MSNVVSDPKSSIYIFSITWFADLDAQPTAHKAFEQVAKRFIYQWERAPTTGNLHLQGYVNLHAKSHHAGNALGKKLNALGMNGVTCRAASDNGKEHLKMYCMKEDTRVAGPWADRPIYMGRDLLCMDKPHPWQQSIIDMIEKEPDDRTILWMDDSAGNVGKTKLLKYLCYKKLAKRIPLGNATQLKTNVIAQGPCRCYCVDLPRTIGSTERIHDLISAIEEIKGGWVTSAMYGKCQEMFMDPPHVIVFSNMSPPIMMMSMDRWQIYTITDLKLAKVAKSIILESDPLIDSEASRIAQARPRANPTKSLHYIR